MFVLLATPLGMLWCLSLLKGIMSYTVYPFAALDSAAPRQRRVWMNRYNLIPREFGMEVGVTCVTFINNNSNKIKGDTAGIRVI